MMFIFSWLGDVWRTPAKARALYIVMTIGFGGLAIVGGVTSDVLVAVVASIFALITAGLAIISPRLAEWTRGSQDVR
jgi:hypothetical protein